jgi:quinol monooxygenase YgiN
MDTPYIYYIPIYPDDDHEETLRHLFSGKPGLDQQILALLKDLDQREHQGEGLDYIQALESKLNLKRISVHEIHRDRSHFATHAKHN